MNNPSSRPMSTQKLVSCILINQLATPGLGSLIARRKLAGTGQLCLSLAGFGLILIWMLEFFYGVAMEELNSSVKPHSASWLWRWGAILFGASWLWALVTSAGLWRDARQLSPGGNPGLPPRNSDYHDDNGP